MRNIFLTCALLCTAMAGHAQSDTLAIGFCNHEVATQTEHKMDGKGWNNAAVYISKDALASYCGNEIVGINAGVVNVLNTDSLKIWIRKEKDGENLAEGLAIRKAGTKAVVKGWNKILFDKPLNISNSTDGLFIGYSYRQKATSDIISIVGSARIGTSFIKQGDGSWTDVSNEGVLSIEALVAGNLLPEYDLGIASATIVPAPSVSPTALKVSLSAHNYGTKAVDKFSLTMKADGINDMETVIEKNIPSLGEAELSFTIDPKVATGAETKWSIAITGIDGGTDCNAENNTTAPYYTYIKNVVLEEFTTEKCSNCPTAAANIHTLLDDKDVDGNIIVVAHHVGFYTDWLTLPDEEDLLWFYNASGNTYAPAAMINRKPYFTSKTNQPTPVFLPTNYQELKAYAAHEVSLSTNAMLSVELDNSNDSEVKVNVGGICNDLYSASNPYIMVYLIENDLKAKSQEGASGTYFQQHVTRASNGIWGEPITWSDNSFSYQTSFSIDPAWNKKNMEVVAFIYNYNKENIKDCAIENAASMPLEKGVTAITTASADKPYEVARYAADGRRVDANHRGLTIIKLSDGMTVKEFIK